MSFSRKYAIAMSSSVLSLFNADSILRTTLTNREGIFYKDTTQSMAVTSTTKKVSQTMV